MPLQFDPPAWLSPQELVRHLSAALEQSIGRAASGTKLNSGLGNFHKQLSQSFLGAIGLAIASAAPQEQGIEVFWRESGRVDHKKRFGVRELLFDLTVVRTFALGQSPKYSGIAEALLALESEFDRNPRNAIHDFNKLVIADAPVKVRGGSAILNRVGSWTGGLPGRSFVPHHRSHAHVPTSPS